MSPTQLYSYFVGAYCGVLFNRVLPRKRWIYCKINVSLCVLCVSKCSALWGTCVRDWLMLDEALLCIFTVFMSLTGINHCYVMCGYSSFV